MRLTTLLAATGATTAAVLLALGSAAPALAAGRADTLGSDTSRVGDITEADIVKELRPAVIGIHQGISGGFVEVPPPNVSVPNVPVPNVQAPHVRAPQPPPLPTR
ncbi:hypothetical protein [Embleya sp. AB8]|uniref:hypothetical protein n=1 Tax=Embleya sp. AB8 TaxID=3156304 RepID=UPI003C753E7B